MDAFKTAVQSLLGIQGLSPIGSGTADLDRILDAMRAKMATSEADLHRAEAEARRAEGQARMAEMEANRLQDQMIVEQQRAKQREIQNWFKK
jgi:hypothetical protein